MKKLLNSTAFMPVLAVFLVFSSIMPLQAQVQMPLQAQVQAVQPVPAAGPGTPMRSISVQGQAQGEYEPDQAVISFSVVSHDKVLAEAKKANDQTLQKLVAVTQKYEIPKEKVVPSGVYISPEYNYNTNTKNGRPQIVGYSVSRNMRITTKDLARQEELLSALIDVKIDQVNNVEFQLAEPEKFASQVRVKAFENAKARAAALAEAAGAKLGPALFITTNGGMNIPPHMPMPMMAMAERGMAKDASVAPSMPGAITMNETVDVTFALE